MMLQPNQFALFFTVALLAITAYFLLGSVPLLILKHDNPVDSSFIRSFYITYFRLAFVAALGTTASNALAGRTGFAFGAAAIATLTLVLRARLIPRMDRLGIQIQGQDALAIPEFRRIHKSAILINTVQLGAILGSLGSF
jgi:UDP-N-acetylmuramyl pentapeptide phosphotransferase/UDP-N-acetylglucosamine-1-phosphate transferase